MPFLFESIRPEGCILLPERHWHDLWHLLMHMRFDEGELPSPFLETQCFVSRRLAHRMGTALTVAIKKRYVKRLFVDHGIRHNTRHLLVFCPDYAQGDKRIMNIDDEDKAWLIGISDFFCKSKGCYVSRTDLHVVR